MAKSDDKTTEQEPASEITGPVDETAVRMDDMRGATLAEQVSANGPGAASLTPYATDVPHEDETRDYPRLRFQGPRRFGEQIDQSVNGRDYHFRLGEATPVHPEDAAYFTEHDGLTFEKE